MPVKLEGRARCPCTSGRAYRDCCLPVHRSPAAAAGPEALMRSRYSAFALGLVDHLMATLHPAHPDRALDPAALRLALAASARGHRYPGLTVRGASEDGDRGEVWFWARVFASGQDLSFEERSQFARDEGVWKYLSGEQEAP